jgi:hypothetical protein
MYIARTVDSANGLTINLSFHQIGVTYNVKEPPKKDKSFNLVVKVITAEKNKVQAQSCVDYTGDGEHSGMAIMEFGLPSGFSLDRDDIEKVR